MHNFWKDSTFEGLGRIEICWNTLIPGKKDRIIEIVNMIYLS